MSGRTASGSAGCSETTPSSRLPPAFNPPASRNADTSRLPRIPLDRVRPNRMQRNGAGSQNASSNDGTGPQADTCPKVARSVRITSRGARGGKSAPGRGHCGPASQDEAQHQSQKIRHWMQPTSSWRSMEPSSVWSSATAARLRTERCQADMDRFPGACGHHRSTKSDLSPQSQWIPASDGRHPGSACDGRPNRGPLPSTPTVPTAAADHLPTTPTNNSGLFRPCRPSRSTMPTDWPTVLWPG